MTVVLTKPTQNCAVRPCCIDVTILVSQIQSTARDTTAEGGTGGWIDLLQSRGRGGAGGGGAVACSRRAHGILPFETALPCGGRVAGLPVRAAWGWGEGGGGGVRSGSLERAAGPISEDW